MPRMPPPDWGRYATLVESRAQSSSGAHHTPLGDPIKWGGLARLDFSAFIPEISSPQFIRAQTQDVYSRLWSAVGTFMVRDFVWTTPAADFMASLEITQGVGQSRVIQEYDLRLLTTIGLTVYRPSFRVLGAPGAGTYEQRGFAIVGGILGNAIEARVIIRTTAVLGLVAEQSYTNVLLAPFAPGQGL